MSRMAKQQDVPVLGDTPGEDFGVTPGEDFGLPGEDFGVMRLRHRIENLEWEVDCLFLLVALTNMVGAMVCLMFAAVGLRWLL
ncbi:hypothetical protein Pcinc_014307 [Petrolisthes cinctipes]|uniref:Uncharacterized protein n=1 Tax=Petrolisthes cinctipes TaxID=88211 RepID=A0AAE1FX46_PETCI|nr:hypothetical protein Pcinc_014307 [Petrolisthes cinctipes]